MKRAVLGIPAAVATAAFSLGMTGIANAAGPGGVETCPSGSFCVYYNSSPSWGSFENFSGPAHISDLAGYKFAHWANHSGYGQGIKDNIAAVVNNTGYSWELCTQTNWTGTCQPYAPNFSGNVEGVIKNQEASMQTI